MSSSKNLEYKKTSFLNKSNSAFIDQMYLKYINNDSDLSESWIEYFSGIEDEMEVVIKEINGPSWKPFSKKIDLDEIQKKIEEQEKKHINSNEKFNFQVVANSNKDSISAVALIRAYRLRGHLLAKLDPLEMMKSEYLDELHPDYYGFKKNDYDKEIILNGVINKESSSIREILKFLRGTYCGPIGYESVSYTHLTLPTICSV